MTNPTTPVSQFFQSLRSLSKEISFQATHLRKVYDGQSLLTSSTSKSPLQEFREDLNTITKSVDSLYDSIFKEPIADLFEAVLNSCASTEQSLLYLSSALTKYSVHLPPPPTLHFPQEYFNTHSASNVQTVDYSSNSEDDYSDTHDHFSTPPRLPQPSPIVEVKTPSLSDLGLSDLAIGALDGTESFLNSFKVDNSQEEEVDGSEVVVKNQEQKKFSSRVPFLDDLSPLEFSKLPSYISSTITFEILKQLIANFNESLSDSMWNDTSIPPQMTLSQLIELAQVPADIASTSEKTFALALVKLGRLKAETRGDCILYSINT
ncbi:hypothetical protein RCL1_004727 [Eukaryota sp. TZLM3-RCL]